MKGADLNGPANRIFVHGPVVVLSTDPDGTQNTATGQAATIELTDRPTTRPTTAPAASGAPPALASAGQPAGQPGPSTRPAKTKPGDKPDPRDDMKMDFMKDKVVSALVLEKDAVVKSSLAAADGGVLREFELKSSLIRYEMLGGGVPLGGKPAAPGAPPRRCAGAVPAKAPPDSNHTGRLIVPAPGQMLVRDHRPAAEKAEKTATPAADDPLGMGGGRGATAFQWARDMTYEESNRTAVMNGDVVVVHKNDDAKEPPARLSSDQVTAVFEPRPAATTRPAVTAAPAAGLAGGPRVPARNRPCN